MESIECVVLGIVGTNSPESVDREDVEKNFLPAPNNPLSAARQIKKLFRILYATDSCVRLVAKRGSIQYNWGRKGGAGHDLG